MANMKFLSLVGNSFGCSASGERLVSAARDGDFLEAKALLEYNPRLARYSTFGVNNSPLHYSASQGHHEIVSLLIESGVDINLRNNRGQTALMQACQYGHWEVVQILILFKANIHRAACLNGGTALHFAALNGHSRCIRLLVADYIPSIPNFCSLSKKRSKKNGSDPNSDGGTLCEIVNRRADGGLTALHMSALNGHAETVHLLLDLGASVSNRTHEDGANIDLIGAGSTPLHYAACGGNTQCCQILIARGASLTAENGNGCTPLMVARSWRRDWLEDVLGENPREIPRLGPSPYICLPLGSIILIARECGWRSDDSASPCLDPCAVCLERKCTVAAEGCLHEFCTQCALYLCSTNTISSTTNGTRGSVPCPLCRQCILSFTKLTGTKPLIKQMVRTRSLSCCTRPSEPPDTEGMPLCRPERACSGLGQVGCHGFSSLKFSLRDLEKTPDLIQKDDGPGLVKRLVRSSRSGHRRSCSQDETRKWLCSFAQSAED